MIQILRKRHCHPNRRRPDNLLCSGSSACARVVKQRCLKLKAEAEAKAPQLSSERRAGDEKAAKEWSSMPSSLDEIDDEIEMLEAETSADRAGADANSLKHFKEKMKQLEEVRTQRRERNAHVLARAPPGECFPIQTPIFDRCPAPSTLSRTPT
eukprot:6213372-Pleurochrysis_carterae.AAC.4